MTHGFRGSFMHAWLFRHGIQHALVDTEQLGLLSDKELKYELASNLSWIDHSREFVTMNYDWNSCPLSVSHYDNMKPADLEKMAKSLDSLLKKKMKIKSDDVFWTAPSKFRSVLEKHAKLLRGKLTLDRPLEFSDGCTIETDEDFSAKKDTSSSTFFPCNYKASNELRHVTNCVYAITMNPRPDVMNMLSDKTADGLDRNNMTEVYQLNNCLQFIYRGCIRAKKKMQLYCIPDQTRELVQKFLKK